MMGGLLRIVFSIIPCRAVLRKKGGQLAFAVVAGAIGLAGGVLLGKRTRTKVRPDMVRKLVYGFMALSGLLYIVTALV